MERTTTTCLNLNIRTTGRFGALVAPYGRDLLIFRSDLKEEAMAVAKGAYHLFPNERVCVVELAADSTFVLRTLWGDYKEEYARVTC